jgi:hypothetical protein
MGRLGGAVLLVLMAAAAQSEQHEGRPGEPYPHHLGITATVFWIGETADGSYGPIENASSAWDEDWQEHYGGVDDPGRREGYRPAAFVPRENPFYCALPYNDFVGGRRRQDAAQVVPSAGSREWGERESMCKNRWVRISRGDRVAYAQWEDVGPFQTDDSAYVFGALPPKNEYNQSAGIDVSPAVRDYLVMADIDRVDWQFVEFTDVPNGPWKTTVTTSTINWH